MIIHYYCHRQFLVALISADMPSLPPHSVNEMTCNDLLSNLYMIALKVEEYEHPTRAEDNPLR